MRLPSQSAPAAALCAAVIALSATAAAQDLPATPFISGELAVEVQNDWVDRSGGDRQTFNDTYATVEALANLHLTHWLILQAGATLEPAFETEPTLGFFGEPEDSVGNQFFRDHGAYIDTLQVLLRFENVLAFDEVVINGGKFTPHFGFVWDNVPGIYGDLFAQDAELAERWGFGASFGIRSEQAGLFTLSGSTFFRDTTDLSNSVFTQRGRLDRSDGGPGNTEDFSNFAIALDLAEPPFAPGLRLHAAVLRQGAGATVEDEGAPTDQTAFALAAAYEAALTDEITVTPVVEWVRSHDVLGFGDATSTFDPIGLGGVSLDGAHQDIVTAGAVFGYDAWTVAAAFGYRGSDLPAAADQGVPGFTINERFVQLSAGYAFEFGLAVDVGWVNYHGDSATFGGERTRSDTIGIRLSYALEF